MCKHYMSTTRTNDQACHAALATTLHVFAPTRTLQVEQLLGCVDAAPSWQCGAPGAG